MGSNYSRLPSSSGYDLKPIATPVVQGPILVILTWLIENIPGIVWLVAKDSGLYDLRDLRIDEKPTQFPYDAFTDRRSIAGPRPALEEVLVVLQEREPVRPFKTSLDYVRKYTSGELTPLAVAESFLAAVRHDEDKADGVHPLVKYEPENVIEQARESTNRYKNGTALGPLDGVLVAVKDEMDALPYTTDVGTAFLDLHPTKDACSVKRLREAGAIIVGKTRMHEFGMDVTGCNPKSGTPKNSYNSKHFAGGSSGGSAAIVGAGFCPIAIGADGGGSIRIPAAYNGVYGLKATGGRISGAGSYPLAPSVGVVGPIASNAYDLALAYFLTAGPDADDPVTLGQPPVSLKSFSQAKSLKGIRLGVFWPYFNDASSDIVDACKKTLGKLEGLGARIVEIELPGLNDLRNSHSITILSEMLSTTKHLERNLMTYPSRIALKINESIAAVDYVAAAKIRTRGMNMLRQVFESCDVIVTPTTGMTAPAIPPGALAYGLSDYTSAGKVMQFIFLANNLGIPAVSCPVGYDSNGLPIGIQFQAKWFQEELLLRLAHVSEHVHAQILRPPPGVVNILP
ncbi:hypothetical protein HDV03_004602 [Kappamyces sp. JEL0829]|nr:hypothetical protein HDV03_004602 [Kappamyces sp. JEL0829]